MYAVPRASNTPIHPHEVTVVEPRQDARLVQEPGQAPPVVRRVGPRPRPHRPVAAPVPPVARQILLHRPPRIERHVPRQIGHPRTRPPPARGRSRTPPAASPAPARCPVSLMSCLRQSRWTSADRRRDTRQPPDATPAEPSATGGPSAAVSDHPPDARVEPTRPFQWSARRSTRLERPLRRPLRIRTATADLPTSKESSRPVATYALATHAPEPEPPSLRWSGTRPAPTPSACTTSPRNVPAHSASEHRDPVEQAVSPEPPHAPSAGGPMPAAFG